MVHVSNLIFNLAKKLLSLFPPTWPFKIYNVLLRIPFLKHSMSLAIRWLTPDHIDIAEGKIIFDEGDPVMAGAISFGKYEPETVAIFRSCLKEGMAVIDIGANLGYFTVIAASRVGPSGKVLAYEPDPHNFGLLERNIAANGFRNVTAIPIALSDRAGTRELFFGDNQTTHSFGDKRGTGRSESVVTDTLDNSLRALGYSGVDIIKMDIEGAEPLVLEGMRETIARNHALTIIFEFHPNAIRRLGYSPLKFLKTFKKFGFSMSVIDEDRGNCVPIDDLPAFTKSFHGKEASKNLIANSALFNIHVPVLLQQTNCR